MNKIIKVMLISLMFILFVPCAVSATRNDLATSNLVILEDKKIDEKISGDVTVVFGTADIQTDIDGSIIVIFGKTTINGNVSGDVVSAFGEVYIQGDSQVEGNLVSVGSLEKADGVSIKGTKLIIDVDFISLFKSNGILINTLIIWSLITLIVGLILISIFTVRYRVMSYSMESGVPRRMLLGGLVVISFTIVLAFLIFLIIAPVLYILLVMFTEIIGSIYFGTIIFKNNYERSAIYLEFFVGHIIISILKIVPLIILPAGSYMALMIYGICLIVLELSMASFGIGTIIDTGFGKNTELIKKERPQ
ncbi:MAG TPA: hypothetical protein VIK78_06210 [Ruminiclostridium sp.]